MSMIRPSVSVLVLTALLTALPTAPCPAADAKNVEAKLAEFEKMIAEQAKQIADQQKKIQEQDRKLADQDRKLAEVARKQDDQKQQAARHEEIRKVLAEMNEAAAKKGERIGVWSKLDIQLYGYVKADMSYDSSRVNTGNFARWVDRDNVRGHDDQGSLTAKETRLGIKITGPGSDNIKTSGVVEVDFFGDGAAENKAALMMRHAYLQIDWIKERFSIIAGQTWDVISPLNPSVLNYSVQWWAGNIGYRRPQIRLTKIFDVAKDVEWKLEAAATRNIGDATAFHPVDTGTDSGLPVLQGRTSWTFPLWCKPTTLGFSGHVGEEENDFDNRDHNREVSTWSANMDLFMPILDWLAFKGELFTGQNLDAFLGGIGQGVNSPATFQAEGIRSCGGWGTVSLTPWAKWQFNVGASMEALRGDTVDAATARTLNRAIFGNVLYEINKNTSVGLELSHWHTEYKGGDAADALRLQTAFIYRF